MLEALIYSGTALYCTASVLAVILLVRPCHFSDRWVLSFAILGCLAFVGALLVEGIADGRIPLFGRFEAISCYCIAVTVAYVYLAARESMRCLSAFILPYTTILLMAGSAPAPAITPALPSFNIIWLAVHAASAFFGYGCFTVASALAVSYLAQDYNLKKKRLGPVFERLPSLETTDIVMRHMIRIAFTFFTISVFAGIRLAHIVNWQKSLLADPKILSVLLTWILYASLLAVCSQSKRHGRRIAQITVLGLAFVLFSFLGIHYMAHSRHDFISTSVEVQPQ